MVDFMKQIAVSVIFQEILSRTFSLALEKWKERVSQGEFLERIQMSVSKMESALERTGKLPITDISLLRRRKEIVAACTKGRCLFATVEQQQKLKNQPVTRSSLRECITTGHATKYPFLTLLGFSKERLLSSSDARAFEWHADSAAKFLRDVESGCSLWHHTFCYPFVRHLLEGKTLGCLIVKPRSKSILCLHPVIVEGRGVEVSLFYAYNDFRKPGNCFLLSLYLQISEDTDIIGISVKCMQQLTTQFKLALKSAIGELTLLTNLQDTFHSNVCPSISVKDEYVRLTEDARPDPICCHGNSCGTLANKSSIEIPEPVILIHFSGYISASRNRLCNAPLILEAVVLPHYPLCSHEEIWIRYGGKEEIRNGSVQQVEEIARSDGLGYLVHEQEPTDYTVYWGSPHGAGGVTLRQTMPRRSRRVSKRKR